MNPSQTNGCRIERSLILILCITITVVYWLTFSKVPTSDGLTWIQNVDGRIWEKIFLPNHLFSEASVLAIKSLLESVFVSIPTLKLIQAINTVLSVISIFLFYRITHLIGFSRLTSFLGTLLWGFSFSLWYFANGEIHHFGVVLLLGIFLLLIRYREKPSISLAIFIGVLHSFANIFHQEHALMLIPIVWMMLFYTSRKGKFDFAAYLLVVVLLTTSAYLSVWLIVARKYDPGAFLKWLFQFLYLGKGHVMLTSQSNQLLRLVKGSLMSWHYGAQILVDFLRYETLHHVLRVHIYAATSILGMSCLVILAIGSTTQFLKSKKEDKIFFLGLFAWFFAYKVLNYKLSPESPEYHLVSTPPLILMLLWALKGYRFQYVFRATLISLLVTMLTVNLFAAILPWKSYGEMIYRFGRFSESNFKPNDFFISCESGLDSIVRTRWNYLSVKDLFLSESKEKGFEIIDEKIDSALAEGRRVFVYNFIPGDYALNGINFYNSQNHFARSDFESFFSRIHKKYQWTPIYQYWEPNYSQYYLFDSTKDTLWQVNRS